MRSRRSVGDTMAMKDFRSYAHVGGGGGQANHHAVTGASRETGHDAASSPTLTF